jgi:hypothetical protein
MTSHTYIHTCMLYACMYCSVVGCAADEVFTEIFGLGRIQNEAKILANGFNDFAVTRVYVRRVPLQQGQRTRGALGVTRGAEPIVVGLAKLLLR